MGSRPDGAQLGPTGHNSARWAAVPDGAKKHVRQHGPMRQFCSYCSARKSQGLVAGGGDSTHSTRV
eukprot:3831792-Prymnesium_polylepis.1